MQQPAIVFLSGLVILGLLFWYLASDLERRKRNIGSLLIAGIIALCVWALVPRSEPAAFTAGELTALEGALPGWQCIAEVIPEKDKKGEEIVFTDETLAVKLRRLQAKLAIEDKGVTYLAVPPNKVVVKLPNYSKADAESVREKIEEPLPKSALKPGIDLAGGAAFTLQVQPKKDDDSGEVTPVDSAAVQQAIKVLESRLNPQGAKDMLIQPQGEDRILLEMPGVSEEEANWMKKIIEKTSVLQLRKVHPQSSSLVAGVKNGDNIVPGYKVYPFEDKDDEGTVTHSELLLAKRNEVDGKYVKRAVPDTARTGVINVVLTSEGGRYMMDLTAPMTKGSDRLAIVLDGVVVSAPVVQDTLSSSFIIQGINNNDERKDLCSTLMNPLENALQVEQGSVVTARLGAAAVSQGIYAGIAGLGLTLLFLALYYRIAGLIALLGLTVSILIIFGSMAMFEFTFTLPGIAGIILTIGIAVDANVLIYERLREEMHAGKSMRSAIQTAYDKAFSAIFDANLTTLITAIILFWRASGTVKGFAVTLTIGILASMFAALVATRVLFWWGADSGIIKRVSFLNLIPNNLKLDFLSKRRIAFLISGLLLVGSLGIVGVKGNSSLGIDFAGGALIRFETEGELIPVPEADAALADISLAKKPIIQNEKEPPPSNTNILTIRCDYDDADKVIAELRKDIELLSRKAEAAEPDVTPPAADDPAAASPAKPGEEIESTWLINAATDTVKASLGKDFLINSVIALGLGLVGILIYITVRFEFSFALGAFVALVHDVLITIGVIIATGGELALIHVGALLTIAGYSINDTIVVFDRIRETLRLKRGDVKDVMNLAISSTLSRTLLTSLTTFFSVMVLYFFGGSALQDFSFAIMVGLIVGTYSSIFVASPIVLIWSRLRGTNLRRELLDADLEAQVNPARS